MLSSDRFAASTDRLVRHFGDDVSFVTVRDSHGRSDPTTRGVIPGDRAFRVPCTPFATYSEKMVDGTRILSGDGVVSFNIEDARVTFMPKPGMVAMVEGQHLIGSPLEFSIQDVNVDAGGVDLQLREGRPA